MWNLWWTKGQWNIFFSLYLGFPLSAPFNQYPSSVTAAIQTYQLTTQLNNATQTTTTHTHTHTHLRSLYVSCLCLAQSISTSGRHPYESKLILSVSLQSLHQTKDLPIFTSTTSQVLEVRSRYIFLSRVTGVQAGQSEIRVPVGEKIVSSPKHPDWLRGLP